MPMFCFSKVVSEVKVLVEGITRSGSSYGTFLLDLGPWSLVLTLHLYGASIDGFGDFVCAMVHFISLIDCTLKKNIPTLSK